MKRASLIAALFAGLVAGCGHTDVYQSVLRSPSPPTGKRAEVYMAPTPPPRPYADVAMSQVVGFGADANLEDSVHALSERAESLGCDAVVQVRVEIGMSISHGFGVCAKWVAEAAPSAQ